MKHRRGSALQRRYGRAAAMTKRFTVTRIRLNSGGYDSRGRYFGTGAPLFSVMDNETERETEVRASSAKAAREKVMESVFGPPPKNDLQGAARVLSKALYAELVNGGGYLSSAAIEKYKLQVEALAAKVRALTPSDRAWDYFDKEMDAGKLHGATQMIAGAAERLKS